MAVDVEFEMFNLRSDSGKWASPSKGRYQEVSVGVPCWPLRHLVRIARMQLELLPEVTHISTTIFLMWTIFPTLVETVEPPVREAVIHVEESVVEILAGTRAISRCLTSAIPGLESSAD